LLLTLCVLCGLLGECGTCMSGACLGFVLGADGVCFGCGLWCCVLWLVCYLVLILFVTWCLYVFCRCCFVCTGKNA